MRYHPYNQYQHPTTSLARRRPPREPGLVESDARHPVSDQIRRKFADGWHTHVPLTFLTDTYCANPLNPNAPSTITETMTYDVTQGTFVQTSSGLNESGERGLNFDQWFQAWSRLITLIAEFFPDDHAAWQTHFNFILTRPDRSSKWPAWLAYDIEIRKRILVKGIDPAVFHPQIWRVADEAFQAKTTEQRSIQQIRQLFAQNSTLPRVPPPYAPRDSRNQGPSASSQSFRTNNPPHPTNQTNPTTLSRRCLICGDKNPTHASKNCHRPRFLKPTAEGQLRDASNNYYCFAWNGIHSCTAGAACSKYHGCTLCGATHHNAQTCPKD